MIRDRGRIKRGGGLRRKHSIDHETPSHGTECELSKTRTRLDVTSVLDDLPNELRELCGELMIEKRSKVLKQRNISPRRFESSLNLIREHFQKSGINQDYKCAK